MLKKVLMIILVISLTIYVLPMSTYASDGVVDANNFKPTTAQASKVTAKGGKILGVVSSVGVVVSVVMMMFLGIKYMVGSVEEKAQYKETMIPYLIGAVLLFASGTIANIVYKFGSSINNS